MLPLLWAILSVQLLINHKTGKDAFKKKIVFFCSRKVGHMWVGKLQAPLFCDVVIYLVLKIIPNRRDFFLQPLREKSLLFFICENIGFNKRTVLLANLK